MFRKLLVALLVTCSILAVNATITGEDSGSVCFCSLNGTNITLPYAVARQSVTIRDMMESLQIRECNVSIPFVTEAVQHASVIMFVNSFNLNQLVDFLKVVDFLNVPDLFEIAIEQVRDRILNTNETLDPFLGLYENLQDAILYKKWDFSIFTLKQMVRFLTIVDSLNMQTLVESATREIYIRFGSLELNYEPLLDLPSHLMFSILRREWKLEKLMNLFQCHQNDEKRSVGNYIFEHVTSLKANNIKSLLKVAPCLKNLLEFDLTFSISNIENAYKYINSFFYSTKLDSEFENLNVAFKNLKKLIIETNNDALKVIARQEFNQLEELQIHNSIIYKDGFAAVAVSDLLKNLKVLKLDGVDLTNQDLKILTESSHLTGLEVLQLSSNKLKESAAEIIAKSNNFSNLKQLSVQWNYFGSKGAQILAASKNLKNLAVLNLVADSIDDEGAQAIAASPFMQKLESLCLSGNRVGVKGARAISNSAYLQNLKKLDLNSNIKIGNEGAQVLALSENMQRLEDLRLSWTGIDAKGVEAIAESSHMQQLKKLDLSFNRIHSIGVRAISFSEHMKNLEYLNFHMCDIGADGIYALAYSPFLQNLKTLKLMFNAIGDTGARHIASSSNMQNLESLDLSNCLIRDDGASAIANSLFMQNLKELNLEFNVIGYAGYQALATSGSMKNLQKLHLQSNSIRGAGAAAFKFSFTLNQLKELQLQFNEIGPDGAKGIAASLSLQNLEVLKLSSNSIGLEGVKAISSSPSMRQLKILNLDSNNICAEGAKFIVSSPFLYRLELMSLYFNDDIITWPWEPKILQGSKLLEGVVVRRFMETWTPQLDFSFTDLDLSII